MDGWDEVADSIDDAIGCLAPLVFIALVMLGFKLFFWVMSGL